MNNYFGTRVRFTREAVLKTPVQIKRTWAERFRSDFFCTTKMIIQEKPCVYKLDGVVYVHPDLVDEIYKIMNRNEDAPTLKVRAVK